MRIAEGLAPLTVTVIDAQTVATAKSCRQIAAVRREGEALSDVGQAGNPCCHFAGASFE
jgi:hypothetical protein